jgi:hypothetical protein
MTVMDWIPAASMGLKFRSADFGQRGTGGGFDTTGPSFSGVAWKASLDQCPV